MRVTGTRAAVVVLITAGLGLLAWFGLEGTPPSLEWDAGPPAELVSGPLDLGLLARDSRAGVSRVEADVDGAQVAVRREGRRFLLALDSAALADGPHVLSVVARDRSLRRNEAVLRLSFESDNTAPVPVLARSSRRAGQGRTLAVLVRVGEPVVAPHVRFLGSRVVMEPLDATTWRALLGIAVEQEPGPWALEVEARDLAGNVGSGRWDVEILPTAFEQGGFVQLTPAQVAARQDRSAAQGSEARRKAACAVQHAGRPLEGPLEPPITGRLTSPFGRERAYSDGRTTHHLGVDLAAPTGTPVLAPGAGVVTLAEELHIYGNSVMVVHGSGLCSSYGHLSEIGVAAGDVVARGDLLGLVGSTGQSTGPHLHWGLNVAGVAVDAMELTRAGFGVPQPGDFDETEDLP